ncbi:MULTISPECIES: restriction endonuclease subunit S [Klebsiella pneumoniae complex]|uniref:restriction endonuclease subunit S n=1 Tax=Klebsiella pneumoniae complex TaxID=3390273 RepID=UPI000F7D959A|nr:MULTISPECIES: restriction endonuclease subunit S [Klebsiella]EEW9990662.1 restriction endonuclease subunit S [Salmonella enterica]EHE6774001.1 restriction endonuclease subunit S [Salmonella enterica subsp. enterica serovar Agona]RTD41435.1 restriction endonuclease subunit S [Klebsiella pneumoniae subsp. pneumoniae]RTD73207.1 restriction endonuclease subunit S [Klebsiella quasipneumoniae subsp. similipneumoniae]HCC2038206.1 restriction endonuclease subunit S [Klebsiella pneumoniae]
MSELSYLEKLLDGVVVEWKTLGEVAKYIRGLTYSKSNESADGQGYRVLRANNITLSSNCLNLNDVKVVKFDTKVKDSQKLYKDDILISAASGSREHVGKVAYIESDIDYYFGGFMGVVRCDEKLNPRYLFHVLTSDIFQKYLDEMLNSSTINNLNSAVMGGFKIPIPCPNKPDKSLAIQAEIVRILDKFTALTAELTAELSIRKKQYNHYRDLLLSFEEGEVEWKTLGEMGTLIRGKRFVKADIIPKGVPCIHYGEMYTHYSIWANRAKSYISVELASKLRKASCGDVVFVSAGETIADIGRGTAWLGDEDVVIHDACFFYKSSLNPKYVAYFSRTNFFHDQIKKSISSGKISAINAKGFEKVIIPVPSPEEQARIVAFLDKFDTLTSSITEGLPREIELRQKQYEYYRDLLFSFPKPETASN